MKLYFSNQTLVYYSFELTHKTDVSAQDVADENKLYK